MTDASPAREEAERIMGLLYKRPDQWPDMTALIESRLLSYGLLERANGMREAAAIANLTLPVTDKETALDVSLRIAAAIVQRAKEIEGQQSHEIS